MPLSIQELEKKVKDLERRGDTDSVEYANLEFRLREAKKKGLKENSIDRRERAAAWKLKNDKNSPVQSLTMTPDAAKAKFMLDVKQQEIVDKAKESGDNVCVYWIPLANHEKRVSEVKIEPRDEVKPVEGKTGTDTQSK